MLKHWIPSVSALRTGRPFLCAHSHSSSRFQEAEKRRFWLDTFCRVRLSGSPTLPPRKKTRFWRGYGAQGLNPRACAQMFRKAMKVLVENDKKHHNRRLTSVCTRCDLQAEHKSQEEPSHRHLHSNAPTGVNEKLTGLARSAASSSGPGAAIRAPLSQSRTGGCFTQAPAITDKVAHWGYMQCSSSTSNAAEWIFKHNGPLFSLRL